MQSYHNTSDYCFILHADGEPLLEGTIVLLSNFCKKVSYCIVSYFGFSGLGAGPPRAGGDNLWNFQNSKYIFVDLI
jgi:hypothetical protein